MIKATLTTTSGEVKSMQFSTREEVFLFIDRMGQALHSGTAVCFDAPLVGIHSGWIQGKKLSSKV